MSDWVKRHFEEDRAAEARKERQLALAEFRMEILKRKTPPLWRKLCEECESCVKVYNTLRPGEWLAVFHTDGPHRFRVERTRPDNAMVTASFHLDGMRVDYRLTGTEGHATQIDAMLGFEIVEDDARLTADDGVISIEAAGERLLKPVLFSQGAAGYHSIHEPGRD
jgi:hypothetical protein